MKSFEDLKGEAERNESAARISLVGHISRIGMTPSFTGDSNPQANLADAIQIYVRAAAQLEVLRVLETEDFYVAMSRSAGATP